MDEREPDESVRGVSCSSRGSIDESAAEEVKENRLSRHFFRDFCHRPRKSMRAEVEEIDTAVK